MSIDTAFVDFSERPVGIDVEGKLNGWA
jgi:hypothetical protein